MTNFCMKATEEVEKMCTFEEMISREQRREGIEENQLLIYTNLKNAAYDEQTICSLMSISMQKLRYLKKLLSGKGALIPKTV